MWAFGPPPSLSALRTDLHIYSALFACYPFVCQLLHRADFLYGWSLKVCSSRKIRSEKNGVQCKRLRSGHPHLFKSNSDFPLLRYSFEVGLLVHCADRCTQSLLLFPRPLLTLNFLQKYKASIHNIVLVGVLNKTIFMNLQEAVVSECTCSKRPISLHDNVEIEP